MLLQDTTHLIQKPCYKGGSPCQHPAGNRNTLRLSDHHNQTQTAVWSCLLFIRSGQNHLARNNVSLLGLKPSKSQRIISGLRETFIKRYVVQRTNKAEQDQKNRVRKRRVVGRIYGTKYSQKGHKDRNGHNRIKRSGQAWLVYVWDINHNIPTTRR